MNKGKVIFKEEQSFVGTWLWYAVIASISLAILGVSMPIWLKGAQESFTGLILVGLISVGVILFLIRSKLSVTIDEHAIYYTYPPFVNKEKQITLADLKEVYMRKYKPIWEYGGWGYRIRPGKGRAMNVTGNNGLQMVFKNNKRLLIGTQKPEAMSYAIRRLKENSRIDG